MEERRSGVLTVGGALELGTKHLRRAGVESARLDMGLMLARVLGTDRLHVYMELERPLTGEEREAVRELMRRRAAREPLAYVLGEKEFYGLRLEVGPGVLIPRPETEGVVERVLAWLEGEGREIEAPVVADVGTGSGAIAVAVAAGCERCRVVATDVSGEALAVARRNAAAHGVAERIEFREGDLLEAVAERVDVLASNPPYVTEGERAGLASEVREWEPAGALFAGVDGLDVLRRLAAGGAARVKAGGLWIVECGAGQGAAVKGLVECAGGYEGVEVWHDLSGRDRGVRARVANVS